MLAWGRPALITAGSIEWTPLSLQNIGNNLIVTLIDGVETTENGQVIFKAFADDNSKYGIINDLHSNQKRRITLAFSDHQGVNQVASKSAENAVINAINQIVNSVW